MSLTPSIPIAPIDSKRISLNYSTEANYSVEVLLYLKSNWTVFITVYNGFCAHNNEQPIVFDPQSIRSFTAYSKFFTNSYNSLWNDHIQLYFGHNSIAPERCLGQLIWWTKRVWNSVWKKSCFLFISNIFDFRN